MNRLSTALALGMGVSGLAGYCASLPISAAMSRQLPTVQEPYSFRSVAHSVLPAVVSIEATMKPTLARTGFPHHGQFPFGDIPGLPDELRKRFEEAEPRPQDQPPSHGLGSGFIIDPQGVIVTNAHVVHNAERIEVVLHDGRRFPAKEIKSDPKTDLAVLRISAKESLPSLQWGASDEMEIGDRVLAIGAPMGMTGTVTSGIISAKGRDIHMNQYEDFLQTDAAINPGNSGGPLVNLRGQVIGVNSAIKSGTGGFQGIGLAISSHLAQDVIAHLRKDGTVHRGYLGVQVQPLSAEVGSRLGVPANTGVIVTRVFPGTPAASAGLADGDIVTAIGGKSVKDGHELQMSVATLPLGKPVDITVFRDGASKTLHVTIREQPSQFGMAAATNGVQHDDQASSLDAIGAKVKDLTPELAKEFGLPEKAQGVVIVDVEANGVAARAGLSRGALILKVDRSVVRTTEDARAALERGSLDSGILLQVMSPESGTSYVLLKA